MDPTRTWSPHPGIFLLLQYLHASTIQYTASFYNNLHQLFKPIFKKSSDHTADNSTAVMSTATTLLNLTVIALLITTAASATVYTNHTVGGSTGWVFNTTSNSSATNYTLWASSQTFNLGDYLIFNTNSNQTVIQTYNESTFTNCTIDFASDDDTSEYYGGSTEFGQAITIPVPLTIVGPNYFFSDADDGAQCQDGMAFEIIVNQGLGLPPSLSQPPPPPYMEPPGPDSAQSPPVIIGGGSQSPGNGVLRSGANVCMGIVMVVVCAFLVA